MFVWVYQLVYRKYHRVARTLTEVAHYISWYFGKLNSVISCLFLYHIKYHISVHWYSLESIGCIHHYEYKLWLPAKYISDIFHSLWKSSLSQNKYVFTCNHRRYLSYDIFLSALCTLLILYGITNRGNHYWWDSTAEYMYCPVRSPGNANGMFKSEKKNTHKISFWILIIIFMLITYGQTLHSVLQIWF